MTIPYVGPINAVAIAYVMEDPKFYKNGRQFAAYAGFAPKHTGTGGETKILGAPINLRSTKKNIRLIL